MAKIDRSEFLDNIQNIITEKLNAKDEFVDNSKEFNIRKYVVGLLEEGQTNPKLMNYLNNYYKAIEAQHGEKEFTLFESFGHGLSEFAVGNKAVKEVISEMNETIKQHGSILEAYMLIEQIIDPAAQMSIRKAYDNYLNCEDDKSCKILIDAIDLLNQTGEPVGPRLTIVITDDASVRLPQIAYSDEQMSDSRFDEIQQQIKDEKERKRMETIKDEVIQYANKMFDEAEAQQAQEKATCNFEALVNNNNLELRESIKRIASSDARSNKRLMETLDQYAGALNQGLFEERLYEGFVQNLSKYNYLIPVEEELIRINKVAQENATQILITKIMEEMSTTESFYLIPLIEEDAARFVKTPNELTKTQFRNTLIPFASDPYCNALLEALNRDNTIIKQTLEERALSVKDQIKMIRENANVCSIYSPVQYIKENECVFNANGQFYVKKGNTLAKLSNEYLNQLSESFITLCQLVNDPHINIHDEYITLNANDKIATIYEGYAEINGCKETTESLRDLNEMYMKYDYDTNFYIMTSCLLENFNNIAKVDFAKHIALNENAGINIDMFKLGNNIFINAVNEDIDKVTFYHNVNPLQCRNIINKHMGINVASLFEDLIPSQDKILLKLNETKNEYESSIDKYETIIAKLEKAKDECVGEDNEEKLDDALTSARAKLADLKKEYKEWQKEVKDNTTADIDDESDEEDDGVYTEEPTKPVDPDEVDVDELTSSVEIPTEEDEEEDPTISDDEFADMLNNDDNKSGDLTDTDIEDSIDTELSTNDTTSELDNMTYDEDNTVDNGFKEVNIDSAETTDDTTEDDECINCETEDETPLVIAQDTTLPETESEYEAAPEGYQIADIRFDRNVKTNEIYTTGSVLVICAKVDREGRVYNDNQTYNFYIDDSTRMPILDAAGIPVSLYNAIVSQICVNQEYEEALQAGKYAETPEKSVFYSAQEINDADAELQQDDEDAFFNFEDDDEGFTITSKDTTSEEEYPTMDSLLDKDAETSTETIDSSTEVTIPTYKSDDGKTDIEFPAANVDDSTISEEPIKDETELEQVITAESAKPIEDKEKNIKAKRINENRSKILSVNSQLKKGDKYFFLNEGTIKPSKKEEPHVNEAELTANVDSINRENEDPITYNPYEEYDENLDINVFDNMHARANKALAIYPSLKVTPILNVNDRDIVYFIIEDSNEPTSYSYTCYKIGNKIYNRPTQEFFTIIDNYNNGIECSDLECEFEDPTSMLSYVDSLDTEEANDLVYILLSHFNSMKPLKENLKIRRPKLMADGDLEQSKLVDDILHGTKERRDFEQHVEQITQTAGVDNPLAPTPQEETVLILPNVHNTINEERTQQREEIVYLPGDWVIIKETDKRALVNDVVNDDSGKLVMLTILASDGILYDAEPNEIMPDPLYLENLPGRVVNSQNLIVPRFAEAKKDPITGEVAYPEDKADYTYKDLNGRTTPVFVVVEGTRLTTIPYSAFLEDVKESKKLIRVINECGEVQEYDANQDLEFEEMPYAVLVNSEGKPVRTIKIDPLSYINAGDDDLVDCTILDKPTKLPKKNIDVLS